MTCAGAPVKARGMVWGFPGMQQVSVRTAGKLALRPIGDHVLVRQKEWQQKVGSLFIPQGSREGYEEVAEIIALGPKFPKDLGLEVGDRVLFRRRAGTAVIPDTREGDPDGMKNLLMLKPDDLIAALDEG